MTDKKSFILYTDQKDTFDVLSNEQAGKLIKGIFAFQNGEEVDKPENIHFVGDKLRPLFIIIKKTLDRDNQKYDNVCERNKNNIKKRWLKHTKNTSGKSGIPEILDSDSEDKNKKAFLAPRTPVEKTLDNLTDDELWRVAEGINAKHAGDWRRS